MVPHRSKRSSKLNHYFQKKTCFLPRSVQFLLTEHSFLRNDASNHYHAIMPLVVILALSVIGHSAVTAQHQAASISPASQTPNAQSVRGLDPHKALTQYTLRHWNNDNGLPSLTITAIEQTPDGYLWLSTFTGLVRFDGVTFTAFNPKNTKEITVNALAALCVDDDGNLWLGSEGGGLLRYCNGKFRVFTTAEGLVSNTVSSLSKAKNGTLWVGTTKGLQQITLSRQTDSVHISSNVLFRGEVVQKVLSDTRSRLWVVVRNQGAFMLEGTRVHELKKEYPALPFIGVTDITEAPDSTLWMTTLDKGLLYYKNSGAALWENTATERIEGNGYALRADRHGTLWISTSQALYRLYQGQVSSIKHDKRLLNARFLEDREGNLWLGTYRTGLSCLSNGKFTTYTETEGLADDAVHCVIQDTDGSMWIGTENGLNHFRDGRFTTLNTAKGQLPNKTVRDVCRNARDNLLWIATNGGLARYDGKSIQTFSVQHGLSNGRVRCLFAGADGTLWGGTESGLNAITPATFHNNTAPRVYLAKEFIHAIHQDRSGTIWVGTNGNGLFAITGDSVRNYSKGFGLSNKIFGICEDSDGVFWLATDNGLCRFQNGTITSYSEDTGFIAVSNTGQLIEDGIGGLWTLTNGKFIRIEKKQLNDFAAGKLHTISPTLYDKFDGIRLSSKASNSRNCRTSDGKIWIPTAGGILVVTPSDIPLNPFVPSVMIESVALDDSITNHYSIPAEGAMRVAAGVKKFEFTFTSLSFIAPERIRFRAQLEGFDDAPFEVGKNKRSVEYTNLERGKTYQFRVTASNNDGVWNDTPAFINLYLEPFFWETRWFVGLCLIATAGIGYQGFQWRVRRLRAKAKVLQQMVAARTHELEQANEEIRRQVDIQGQQAQEIELANTALQEKNQMLEHLNTEKSEFLGIAAHDMKSPLAGMMMNVGLLRRYYDKMSTEELMKQFTSLEHTIRRMSDIISNLLDINAIETGNMKLTMSEIDVAPLMQQYVQEYSDRAAAKNITIHFSADAEQLLVLADASALAQVVDNLLSNAVKYSPQGKCVFVRLLKRDSLVRIEIQDEGNGISPEEIDKLFGKFVRLSARPTGGEDSTGLGLSIVKKLVEAMNGKVWCESHAETDTNTGATFIVELPGAESNQAA